MSRNYIEAFYTFQKYVTYRDWGREVIRVNVYDDPYYGRPTSTLKYVGRGYSDVIADLIKLSDNTYVLKLNLDILPEDTVTKMFRNIIRGCRKYLGVKLDVEVRVLRNTYYCIVIPNGITYRYRSYSPTTILSVVENGKRVDIEANARGYISLNEEPELAELLRKYVRLYQEYYEILYELINYGSEDVWSSRVPGIPKYDLNVDLIGSDVVGYWLDGTYHEYRNISEVRELLKKKFTPMITYLQHIISEMKEELTMHRILNT